MPRCGTRNDENGLQTRCDTSWPDGWKRGKGTQRRKDAKTQRNPHFFFAPLRLCAFAFFPLDWIYFRGKGAKRQERNEGQTKLRFPAVSATANLASG
jgi:hypothetical protein